MGLLNAGQLAYDTLYVVKEEGASYRIQSCWVDSKTYTRAKYAVSFSKFVDMSGASGAVGAF